MNQILRINNFTIDIDEQTAIGVDLQAYDFKNPAQRLVNVSNDFTIPKTVHNLRAIGYLGELQNNSNSLYRKHSCTYSIDNFALINNGKCNIVEIGERIKLSMQNRSEIWDICKQTLFNDFLVDYIKVMGLPTFDNPESYANLNMYLYSFSKDNLDLSSKDKTIILAPIYNHINKFLDQSFQTTNVYLNYINDGDLIQGGCFFVFYHSIFRYLEIKYGIDFGVLSDDPLSIFNDKYALTAAVNAKALTVYNDGTDYYYNVMRSGTYTPYNVTEAHAGLTLFECIDVFLKQFNILIDDYSVGSITKFKLYRFDDLDNAPQVILKDKISVGWSIKPTYAGLTQINKISFEKSFDGAPDMYAGKYIYCLNENIDSTEKDLIKIKSFIGGNFEYTGERIEYIDNTEYSKLYRKFITTRQINRNVFSVRYLDLSHEDSFKFFSLIVFDAGKYGDVVADFNGSQYSWVSAYTPNTYILEGEYNYLQRMMFRPLIITTKVNFTLNDLLNLKFFKKYFIPELGGSFFLNKITGLNPKSNDSINVELIKLP